MALTRTGSSSIYKILHRVLNKYARHYSSLLGIAAGSPGADYVGLGSEYVDARDCEIRSIAFYLPQYHPVPVNDEAWGKGFTEWTNVSKAVAQFEGHYQPRLPGELGYYDLRIEDIQRRQIELAKLHGIHGFCYYHYWFAGTKVLERPFQKVLANPSLDLPFCLCWANAKWSRRMNGGDNSHVIIPQSHSAEDDIAFLDDIREALLDSRYIRVNNKPLLMVYRPHSLPDALATARRWQERAKSYGLEGLYLVFAGTNKLNDPEAFGFDGAVQFPPHSLQKKKVARVRPSFYNKKYSGRIFSYNEAAQDSISTMASGEYTFPGIFMNWDNDARKPGNSLIFHGGTPARYKRWLEKIFEIVDQKENRDEKLVFINAWNEWSEGTYLEPDLRFGYGYLQATADTIKKFSKKSRLG